MQKYEWLGDIGEICGVVVFPAGSRGRIVELDETIVDPLIADGFQLKKIESAEQPEKEVIDHGSI